MGMGVFGGFIALAQPVTGGFESGALPSLLLWVQPALCR